MLIYLKHQTRNKMKNQFSKKSVYGIKKIEKMSTTNARNSIECGNAKPIKRPRPPPILLIKVNPSVLGICVIFKESKSPKEK